MGDLIINWRFGSRHLQVGGWPWVTLSRNPHHASGGQGRSDPNWRWFQVY